MKIKKFSALITALVLSFPIASCSDKSSSPDSDSSSVTVSDKADSSSQDNSSEDSDTAPSDADDDTPLPDDIQVIERAEGEVTFSHSGGVYDDEIELTLESDAGAVYYTTDGSDPAISDTREEYTGSIKISSRENDKNVVSAVDPTLISANFNELDLNEKGYVCDKKAPSDEKVDKCTVIRAAALAEDGKYTATTGETYYIGSPEEHIKGLADSVKAMGTELAVISIGMDYNDLFDSKRGIYVKGDLFDEDFAKQLDNDDFNMDAEGARKLDANYKQRGKAWERPCHIDFFEFDTDGAKQVISQECGIRVQGNYSRSDLIKGLRLFARKDYGGKRFEYDVFRGKAVNSQGEAIESFKNLTLRAGGNCAFTAKFNDTYWQDMSSTLDCSTQASRPCVVYLNGEYWGLYVLQEDYSDDYFEDHYGVNKDNVVVYKGDAETYSSGYKLDEGTLPDGEKEDYFFKDLKSFFRTHSDLSDKKDYDEFAKLVDTDSVRDYFLSEVWINNKWDWPGKNWSMWKSAEIDDSNEFADGRWRFLFYDMEFGGVSGEQDAYTNTVKDDNYKHLGLLDQDTNNPAVLSFALLMTNDDFRADYNKRLLELKDGIYKKETLLAGIEQYENEYSPLFEQFFDRYPDTGSKDDALTGGYASSKCIRDFVEKREDNIEKMTDWITTTLG